MSTTKKGNLNVMKTIEDLQADAEYNQLMVDLCAASEEDYRQEMLRCAADKLMYQRDLDAAERALIIAMGESS